MFDANPTRRHLLQVGTAGLMGMSLPQLLRASDSKKSKTKAVIFLHQYGGPSQFETFDMKPDAPAEIRGTFKPIKSKQVGLPVCEMLPKLAALADKYTVIRSIQHNMKNHNSAAYYSLTGVAPPTDDQRLRDSLELFPAIGSIVDKFAPAEKGTPTFVSYPFVMRDGSISPGQHASFLGKTHNPLFFTQDPNSSDFRLPELSLPASLSPERLENRKEVLKIIDQQAHLIEQSAVARGVDESFQKAVSMLSSPQFKRAFDLSDEKKESREKYGRTTYGQSCLLARRLVEAGAKFINVYLSASIGGDGGGWDTHGFNDKPMDPILKNYLLPLTDKVVSALLIDLQERGLLETTTVLWMGEFGRSPRINKLAGRDHWPQCYPALMCGGGIKPGMIYGASDKIGAYPDQGLCRPEDISATLFHLFGIDPETEIRDKLNRPFPVSRGKAISEILL